MTEYAWAIREGLDRAGIRGEHDGIIDHIELFAEDDRADSRSFVLCPGKAGIDRPAAPAPAPNWPVWQRTENSNPENRRQASIIGSEFTAHFVPHGDKIVPTIRGEAWVCGDNKLILNPEDPFRWGSRCDRK